MVIWLRFRALKPHKTRAYSVTRADTLRAIHHYVKGIHGKIKVEPIYSPVSYDEERQCECYEYIVCITDEHQKYKKLGYYELPKPDLEKFIYFT